MIRLEQTRRIAQLGLLALLVASIQALPTSPARASNCDSASFSSGGNGTSADPFLLSTEAEVKNLRFCLGASHSDKHFQLSGNVALATSADLPIGDQDNRFSGQIDGGGHTLTLPNLSGAGTSRGGLFGYLESATIASITISGSVYSFVDAGLLAGAASASALSDITTFGYVQGTGSVGGLVGASYFTTFSNVVINANPSISKTYYVESSAAGGGVVGAAYDSVVRNSRVNVSVFSSGRYAAGLSGVMVRGQILNSFAEGDIRSTETGSSAYGNTGGLVGRLIDSTISGSVAYGDVQGKRAGGLAGLIDGSTVETSHAYGDVRGPNSTNEFIYVGGLVGQVESSPSLISFSSAKGAVSTARSDEKGFLGGLIGKADVVVSVDDSYAAGNVSSTGTSATIGGLIGEASTATIRRSFALGAATGGSIRFPFIASPSLGTRTMEGNLFLTSNLAQDDSADSTELAEPANQSSFSDIATFVIRNYDIQLFSQTSGSSTSWLMCDASPVLTSEPAPDSCPMYPVSGSLDTSGQILTLTFNGEISELPDSTAFATTPSVAIASIATTSDRVLQVQLNSALPGNVDLSFSYTKPSDPSAQLLKRSGADSIADSFTYRGLVNNSNLSGPIVLSLAFSNIAPTAFDISFGCGGSCDQSAPYDYVASITPSGGSTTTHTSTTTGTATKSFTDLAPNTAHLITVTVTQGGLTSPATTLNATTPKPIATISALTVADTSATLTVGCTNCGADPDSFTISATPQGGGAAITSNTNVISGLTSETTYSFAVVIAFAGTTSDSVNWQGNPVMTLPFVPIITEVLPDQVPLTGGTITITGSNFSTSSLVMIGSTSSAFTIVSSTSMTVSGTQALAGSYDISITNPVGTFTLSNAITYVSGPTLSTNSPVLATTNGGTIVTLTGTDLATTTQVNVGSTTVSFSVVSNTSVRFVTAATSAGIVDVGVVTVGGTATKPNGLEFTDSALVPVVSSITPATGPIAGGTTVTITGQFFSGSYSDSVSAAIDGISGSSLVLIDDSTLTFVTPAHAEGTGFDVTVLTGGGLGTLAGAFSYTAPPVTSAGVGSGPAVILSTPEINSFSTRQLAATGGQITAEGRRLADISSMTLGGIRVTIVSNTDTSVTFTVLEMPVGTWDLRLVGANGTLTFQQAITIVGQEVVLESTPGTMLGFTMTLRFTGNNRTLNVVQERNLTGRLDRFSTAETIICWGYTTAANPNAWAIAHATARAKAACDLAIGGDSALKSVVRLRYGVSKDFAMRAALQFWR
jgi:hypothetical protein